MDGFPEGHLEELITRQYILIDEGGIIIAAFDRDILVGAASVENKARGEHGEYRNLDIFFVSKDYRGQGVGKKLIHIAGEKCRELGGRKLYISATPSKNTVEFYMNNEAVLVKNPDKELYKREPEDIHLEIFTQQSV